MKFLARLYPRKWRERYGEEFSALLEDMEPGWRDSMDIVKGALVMQMSGWNTGKTLAIGGMLGALVAFGISFAIPKKYASQAVIKVTSTQITSIPVPALVNRETTDQINSLAQTVLSRSGLTQIIDQFGLYQRERGRMPIEDVIEGMRKSIQIRPLGKDPSAGVSVVPAFMVQFTYGDPLVARQVTQDLVSRFIDENVRSRVNLLTKFERLDPASIPKQPIAPTLELLDPASLPKNPVAPRMSRIVIMGLVGGLMLAGVFALVRRPSRFAPVFEGSDVPVRTLIDSIASGQTLDQFLAEFPTVTKESALAALGQLGR